MSQRLERLVLIGVDDSDGAEFAFDYYVQHLHRPTNRVTLLYVVPPFIISSNQNVIEKRSSRDQAQVAEKETIKKLQRKYQDKMKFHSIPGRLSIISYSKQPGKIICETATEDHYHFVVVGSRVPAGKAYSTGGVVDYLVKKAKCPVAVVRCPDQPLFDARRSSNVSITTVDTKFQVTKMRRVSCPSKFSYPSDLSASGPGSAQPIASAKQRRHSTFVAPRLDQLALCERTPPLQQTAPSQRRLSVKYEEDEDVKYV